MEWSRNTPGRRTSSNFLHGCQTDETSTSFRNGPLRWYSRAWGARADDEVEREDVGVRLLRQRRPQGRTSKFVDERAADPRVANSGKRSRRRNEFAISARPSASDGAWEMLVALYRPPPRAAR
eukprot:CAMPEP_0197414040 /NCGR_PEP_ID=MMETSP1170-20131217/828_1 /TAXON_ID=54406 /ORGANISM="Sarcinochrysis sp, Strain CCMP770" /LENGTH=122 /DNA_ID=CAMNT_0042940717 /DNA_START=77 /DNA_END=445 /DNA_ORIENTATION=-